VLLEGNFGVAIRHLLALAFLELIHLLHSLQCFRIWLILRAIEPFATRLATAARPDIGSACTPLRRNHGVNVDWLLDITFGIECCHRPFYNCISARRGKLAKLKRPALV